MRKAWGQRIALIVTGIVLVTGLVLAWLPSPVLVELRAVERGRLEVVVEDDGQTRIKEKYVISSPLAGRLSRVPWHAGDPVKARDTILTTLSPTAPSLLDERARVEAENRLKVAEASRRRAEPLLDKARQKVGITQEEFARIEQLFGQKVLTHEQRDRAKFEYDAAREEMRTAQFDLEIADFEIEVARAALLRTRPTTDSDNPDKADWLIDIRSPVSGRILRVLQESSAVVAAGAPLLEVGDPEDLEVVVDILSSDAVKIRPGNRVTILEWGGATPLQAHVRLVEPSGFTKVSALGIEEKRVNVIIDFDSPLTQRPTLGDDFRIEARIIVDQADDALLVPTGALFPDGDHQAVYIAVTGRAELRTVATGRRGQLQTEVLRGLQAGDQVIVYPSDKVRPGVQIRPVQ